MEIPRKSKANLETFVEVSCSLKQSRKKHATTSDIDDYIAEGYRVSVSNDGVTFSEEDILIIFDSLCVNCSKTDGKVTCIRKVCIIHKKCDIKNRVAGFRMYLRVIRVYLLSLRPNFQEQLLIIFKLNRFQTKT